MSIYVGCFKNKITAKLKEEYKVSILEMPYEIGDARSELLEELDKEFKESILILEEVNV